MVKTIYWYEYRSENKAKKDFENYVFKLMNNAVFVETMENVKKKNKKHRDIKLVRTEVRRDNFVSEPNYNMIKLFSENLWAIEMKKFKYTWINLPI